MTGIFPLLALAAAGPAKISTVVVYPDRARVTRTARIACGPALLLEATLPPAADPASLRASVVGGDVRGLWSEERTRANAFAPEAEALQKKIRELQRVRAKSADLLAAAEDQATLAAAYEKTGAAAIAREMADPPRALAPWQTALHGPLDALTAAGAQIVKIHASLRDADRELAELQSKLARLEASSGRRERVAQLLLSCPDGQTAEVELSYTVGGVSWTPVYEARADPDASSVALSVYATLNQATGEAWTQARLILSTATPLANALPPTIEPLYLSAQEREAEKKVLATRTEAPIHAEGGGATTRDPGPRVAARDQGLSVQLELPEPADVPGDGTPVRLRIAKEKLDAHFASRTAPALAPFVFRVADLADQAPFPLLAGEVETFWRGGFVGRQALARVAQGAPFHLTFGIDDAFKVHRAVLEEVRRDKGLFGNAHRLRYGYRLTLSNFGRTSRSVEVAEQIPVSELDDVRVEVEPSTTPGYQLAAQDGRLTWQLVLEPSVPKSLDVHFHVDIPGSYESEGL